MKYKSFLPLFALSSLIAVGTVTTAQADPSFSINGTVNIKSAGEIPIPLRMLTTRAVYDIECGIRDTNKLGQASIRAEHVHGSEDDQDKIKGRTDHYNSQIEFNGVVQSSNQMTLKGDSADNSLKFTNVTHKGNDFIRINNLDHSDTIVITGCIATAVVPLKAVTAEPTDINTGSGI